MRAEMKSGTESEIELEVKSGAILKSRMQLEPKSEAKLRVKSGATKS